MLRCHRPTKCNYVAQSFLDCSLNSGQLVLVPGNEVLMRVSVAGMSVNHWLRNVVLACDRTRRSNCFGEFAVWHRPVSRDFSTASVVVSASPLVHRRRNAVTHSPRFAKPRLAIENDRFELRSYGLDQLAPLLEAGVHVTGSFLFYVNHRRRITRNHRARCIAAGEFNSLLVEILDAPWSDSL